MTVKEFVEKILPNNFNLIDGEELITKLREEFPEGNKIRYTDKAAYMKEIALMTCFVEDGNKNRIFHSNSIMRHILFYLTMVQIYSKNIEIDLNNSIEEYAILENQGLLNAIVKYMIDQDEIKEMKNLLDDIVNDYILNTKIENMSKIN